MESLRKEAPSSYLMKLVGFSAIRLTHQPYESDSFDTSGHKWRLTFHPAGKKAVGGNNHVWIYARIEDVAAFEMLMHKECGFAQLLPIPMFNDPCNGYIDEEASIVSIEIFFLKPIEKLKRVGFTHNTTNNKFTWKISEFSKLGDKKYHYSDEFVVERRNWNIVVNPKGENGKNGLSIVSSTYGKLKLRLLNQKNFNHFEKNSCDDDEKDSYGVHNRFDVEDIEDDSGYDLDGDSYDEDDDINEDDFDDEDYYGNDDERCGDVNDESYDDGSHDDFDDDNDDDEGSDFDNFEDDDEDT